MAYDINETAGTIFGIAGMGIGLGLLANTARNVSRAAGTDNVYGVRYQRYKRIPMMKRYSLAKPQRMRTQAPKGTPKLSIRPRVQRTLRYQRNPMNWW